MSLGNIRSRLETQIHLCTLILFLRSGILKADDTSLFDLTSNAPAVDQTDLQFRDLFGIYGSGLCGPASISHRIIAEKYRSGQKFNSIVLPGGFGPQTDPANLIRWLFEICKTGKNAGTTKLNFRECASEAFEQTGIGKFNFRSLSNENRLWKGYLKSLKPHILPAFLEVGFYKVAPPLLELKRVGGHFMALYSVHGAYDEPTFKTDVYDSSKLPGDRDNAKYFTELTWRLFKPPAWLKREGLTDYILSDGSFLQDDVIVLLDDVLIADESDE